MKVNRRIYIGFDKSEPIPYYVARQSLIGLGVPSDMIFGLSQQALRAGAIYWRDEQNERASTEFAFTRFLVPYLSGYQGVSMFCDADFLWRKDPRIVLDVLAERDDPWVVGCVKHRISEYTERKYAKERWEKMGGKYQKWYDRKNWSSMMIFNNRNCLELTPTAVSERSADWLHGMKWASDDKIVGLPKTMNHLVGYAGYNDADPMAVHFTDGGPWLEGYEEVDYAWEWRNVQQST